MCHWILVCHCKYSSRASRAHVSMYHFVVVTWLKTQKSSMIKSFTPLLTCLLPHSAICFCSFNWASGLWWKLICKYQRNTRLCCLAQTHFAVLPKREEGKYYFHGQIANQCGQTLWNQITASIQFVFVSVSQPCSGPGPGCITKCALLFSIVKECFMLKIKWENHPTVM